jgi:predicted HicB family RNase H-like nuclease
MKQKQNYRLGVYLPPDLEAALKQEAKETGISMNTIVRLALVERYRRMGEKLEVANAFAN